MSLIPPCSSSQGLSIRRFTRAASCIVGISLASIIEPGTAQELPAISYPPTSIPAIKLGNPLPEDLVPANTGGAIPARPYRRVDTFAGSGSAGGTNATGTAATFNGPWGISRDAHGNLYVADFTGKRIRKITPAGVVSLIDEFGSFEPIATAIDPATGHLYCAIATHRILRYLNKNVANYPAQAPVYGPETDFLDATIVYIGASTSGTSDSTGTSARLNNPSALTVRDGVLFVADRGNNRVRKVNLANAAVETVSFTGGTLNAPEGISVAPDGAIYVANSGGDDLIQKIQGGVIQTYAGSGSGYANGMAAFAKFDNPRGLAMDAEGNLFVAEGNNNAIRRISPDGWVTPIAGHTVGGYDASNGYQDNIGDAVRFNSPRGIVLAPDGLLYITDHTNHRIRRLSLTGYEIEPALPAGLTFDIATGVISGTATELTPEGGELFPYYQNTFSGGLGMATIHGNAQVTTDYLQRSKLRLTSNTATQSGGITVPAGNLNVQELALSFILETTKASGGGQGLSYNFGEGVSGGQPSWIWAESGIGEGLSLSFDPFGDSGGGVKGVRLLYGTKFNQPGTTPGVNGVLAYSPSVAWVGKSAAINLTIDALSRVSLTIDGQAVFTHIPLPSAYSTADKSKWTHAILARTDASASDEFAIDDLFIRQSLSGAALYQVTGRNASGRGSANVKIDIKEAPAIALAFNLSLDEDKPSGLYQPVGESWKAFPAQDQNNQSVALFRHVWDALNVRERAVLAADANLRHFVGIGDIGDTRALEQRFKSRALYRYSDGDSKWQRLTAAGDEPWMTLASNGDGSVLVAGTTLRTGPGSSIPNLPGLLRYSTDSGATWGTYTLPNSSHWVSSISINGDGSRIYAGAMGGALYVSRDRGTSWQTVNPSGGFEGVSHVACSFTGDAVQALVDLSPGLFLSSNSGTSWSNAAYSRSDLGTATYYGMSGDGSFRFMGTYQGRLNVETPAGWERVDWPNTNVVLGGMYASSHDGGRFHVLNAGRQFCTSRDRGATWTTKNLHTGNALPGIGYLADGQLLRTLLTSYRGTRVAFVYDGKVYTSEGSGLELTHSKGDSHVISVSLSAPDGSFRATALEGVTLQGNGSSNLVVTGPLGLLNQILESLTYQGGADFTGAAGFTVTASASGVSNTQTDELTIQDAAQPDMASLPTSSAIAETSATLGGTVLGNGGSALTSRGVVISPTSANPSPVRGGNEVIDLTASGADLGAFTVNATGLLPGTSYRFRAYAANANGPQYSEIGTFTTAGGGPGGSPSASWRTQYFGTAENSGNAANLATPDGDGIANIIKYALGLTPGQSSSHLLPRPSSSTEGGQRHLSIRFNRVPARDDVTIAVEALSDLGGSWTELARSTRGGAFRGSGGIAETPNSDGTVDCEVSDTVAIDQATKRFMRVRVIAE